MDAHKNFAYTTVTAAPSPANSGPSLTVASGSVLPAVPFNATVWPAGDQPLQGNAEIVRVTVNAAGVLTILRAQEGSSARAIQVGDQFSASITVKTLTDIEAQVAKVGSLGYGAVAPDATYLPMDGETVLSQAIYAALFGQVGLEPDFKLLTSKTLNVVGPNPAAAAWNGSNLYVMIANSSTTVVWTSPDGKQWNLCQTSTPFVGSPQTIAYCSGIGGGVFVVTDNNGNMYYSTDGVSWTMSVVTADQALNVIACSATRVLVAGVNDADNSINYVWTSDDLVTWTRRTCSSGSNFTAAHYSSGVGVWLLGTTNGHIWSSPDAITWTDRSQVFSSGQVSCFDSSPTQVCATASLSLGIAYSADGSIWNAGTGQFAKSSGYTMVGYNAGAATWKWMAIGTNSVAVSQNGQTWYQSYTAVIAPGLIWDGANYFMAASGGLLLKSPDLVTWTPVAAPSTTTMQAGDYGNGVYMFVGASGKLWRSTDGSTFTETTPFSGTMFNIKYAAGITTWVASGGNGTYSSTDDGTTWTLQVTVQGTGSAGALTWNGVLFALVNSGNGGYLATSPDGITWTGRTTNTTQSLKSVAWDGTAFCAVGVRNTVITSTNGTAWVKKQMTGGARSNLSIDWIVSDGTNFYALSQATATDALLYLSSDHGVTWSVYGAPNLQTIFFRNSLLVGFAQNTDIYSSFTGKSWALKKQGIGFAQNTTTVGCKMVSDGTNLIFPLSAQNTSAGGTTAQGGFGYTTDGLNFNVFIGLSQWFDIAYSTGHRLVMCASAGQVAYSDDGGANWTRTVKLGIATQPLALCYSPSLDRFVMTVNGMLWYGDGATWTQAAFSSPALYQNGAFTRIIWSAAKNLFVAVGTLGLLATSPDGITWADRSAVVTTEQIVDVCYNAALGLFVAVTPLGRVLTSTDGLAWTLHRTGIFIPFLLVLNLEANGFIGIGSGNTAMATTDGINWTLLPQLLVAGIVAIANGVNKSMYSTVDNAALTPSGTFIRSPFGVMKYGWAQSAAPGSQLVAVAYDSANDRYVATGLSGTVQIFQRTYNKATQFILPYKENTWIKATV